MKKIVRLLLIALCMSPMVKAQSYDDLYYNPKKDAVQGRKDTLPEKVIKKQRGVERHTYVTSDMPVVVRDRQGNARDIDEYNRRYDASENDFEVANDTLYVDEKENPEEGRWINGFNGTQDDYEYAQRIIRFRNPRFAVSVSSPYYWDIVYGLNSWDWNVYTDDYYAYAFPTFTNRLWSDWRFGSLGMGWGFGWNYPYYGGFYDGYYGYNSGYWGGFYGGIGYPYYGGYYGGWNQWHGGGYGGHWASRSGTYNTRRLNFGDSGGRRGVINGRSSGYSRVGEDRTSSYSRRSGVGRVVGTRTNDSGVSRRLGNFRTESGNYVRPESSGRTGYTRPSSTRSYSNGGEGISRRSSSYSRSESGTPTRTYSRGSSATSRSYSGESSSRRSYDNSSSSSSRSYSPSNSGSSRSSGSSGGNSGSSRSSGGSSGGGSSRSGGRR